MTVGSFIAIGLGFIILGLAVGVPLTFLLINKKVWSPEFLRPNGRIDSFPGVRYEGVFLSKEVDEGFKVFRDLWVKHVGGSEKFASMFNFIDIRFVKTQIISDSYGREVFARGIVDSKHSARVFDENCAPIKDDKGNFVKSETGTYICEGKSDFLISETSLGHELVHLALWATTGEPDHDHQGNVVKQWNENHSKVEHEWTRIMQEKGL